MPDIFSALFPLTFFAMLFGFLLLWRELRHRHLLERLRLERGSAAHAPADLPPPDDAAALALHLPEPHRLYALALLCRLQDLRAARLDSRTAYLVAQSRSEYLPRTLRAYLNLTPSARSNLHASGQSPEEVLREQLELISQGIDDALSADQSATRQVLTQGHFLREVFGREAVSEKLKA